ASTSASVPLATPIVSGTPRYAAASASNAAQLGPNTNCPSSSTPAKACCSSGISGAYCARTSTSGIFGTPGNGRRALPVPGECNRREDEDDERDPDVGERVVERVVARPERPAACAEAEAERGAADRREWEELRQRLAEETGGDGDERADHRRREAERDRDSAEALEPALGSVHPLLRDVKPLAVALDQRPPSVEPDRPADARADGVAEHAGDRHRHVSPRCRVNPVAEERDVPGDVAGSDGSRVDHDELAGGRYDRRGGHQPEHRVDRVVADEGGEGGDDQAELGYCRRTAKAAERSLAPTWPAAKTCA